MVDQSGKDAAERRDVGGDRGADDFCCYCDGGMKMSMIALSRTGFWLNGIVGAGIDWNRIDASFSYLRSKGSGYLSGDNPEWILDLKFPGLEKSHGNVTTRCASRGVGRTSVSGCGFRHLSYWVFQSAIKV